ncbi:tyrosine-type recombinase/integrase [Steroidobacter sp.]|uniref:tyrosine-type recombinase/integrase n=1 Tax=Steroidobacter sp. TaxID=1978227 RepID=UPI001A4BFE7A|nr:integrase arm-type DNA-binding domain-containing protein [Steroidobacter sp.]MBL8271585.1 tyrosine-type recombinase/integrase [Steroidobacter sp.]
MPKLSDTKIRGIKPRLRPYKLFDTDGLYLLITPSGGKWWRQRYRWGGKEKLLSLGTYPDIGLAKARERGEEIRKQVANGIDPAIVRTDHKIAKAAASETTFKAITLEWIENMVKAKGLSADHIERTKRRFEVHFFPWLGHRPIAEVTDDDVLGCIRRMEGAKLIDTAHRALSQSAAMFRYAKKRKYVSHSPVAELIGADTLPAVKVKHHAAIIEPAKVGALMRALDAYDGSFVVRCALRITPLLFVRPGELRHAEWPEFNLDVEEPEWRIPANKMKMREQHIVPLSRQAVAILRELESVTGADGTGYVFPSNRNTSRPMSENTINVALRACGYSKDQQTAHGFRTTASTLLNEQGVNRDAIERQLAHGERDKVRAAYNAAEYLPERRKMMQGWSDHLDGLKATRRVK